MASILIVEDNSQIAFGLKNNLEYENFSVQVADTGTGALELMGTEEFDIMILDLMLPDINGYKILKKIRKNGNHIPVIILSAKGEEMDKLHGFRLGADDFITKPFGLLELIARINAVLNRTQSREKNEILEISGITIDINQRTVRADGGIISLTPLEFDLLVVLVQNNGNVATREHLLQEVWGYSSSNHVSTRTIDSHIASIRSKISIKSAHPFIQTVPKVGYRVYS